MKMTLQPDPWSATWSINSPQVTGQEMEHLYGTHTSFGHAATLVWPGMLRPEHVENPEEPASQSPSVSGPRWLTKRAIHCEAARANNFKQHSAPASARHTFGRGQLAQPGINEETVAKRVECRGKYTG